MFPWSSSIPSWPTPPHSSPTAPSPTAPTTWTTSHLVPTPHNALQHSAPLHGLHGPTSTTPTSTPMLTPGPAEHFFGQPSELQVHWTHHSTTPSRTFPPLAPAHPPQVHTGPQPLPAHYGPIPHHPNPLPATPTFSTQQHQLLLRRPCHIPHHRQLHQRCLMMPPHSVLKLYLLDIRRHRPILQLPLIHLAQLPLRLRPLRNDLKNHVVLPLEWKPLHLKINSSNKSTRAWTA